MVQMPTIVNKIQKDDRWDAAELAGAVKELFDGHPTRPAAFPAGGTLPVG